MPGRPGAARCSAAVVTFRDSTCALFRAVWRRRATKRAAVACVVVPLHGSCSVDWLSRGAT